MVFARTMCTNATHVKIRAEIPVKDSKPGADTLSGTIIVLTLTHQQEQPTGKVQDGNYKVEDNCSPCPIDESKSQLEIARTTKLY